MCHQDGSIVLVTRPSAAFGPAAPEWQRTKRGGVESKGGYNGSVRRLYGVKFKLNILRLHRGRCEGCTAELGVWDAQWLYNVQCVSWKVVQLLSWGSLGHPLDGTTVSRGLTSATAKSITNIDPAKSINVKSFARKSQMTLEGELWHWCDNKETLEVISTFCYNRDYYNRLTCFG